MTTRMLERKFTKPAQISRHLTCSICTEVFLDPTRLNCGHTFCKKCITHWEKNHNTCPWCRGPLEKNLMGKDLIADKIIQDLEVFCVNQLCEWKDKLENLNKHVKSCPFAKTPEWLSQAQNYIKIDEPQTTSVTDMYIEADETYQERVNEEVSRKSLLERLYTRSETSKSLVDSVFNTNKDKENEKDKETSSKKKVAKGKGRGRKAKKQDKEPEVLERTNTFQDYENFLCAIEDSDEETKEDQTEALTLDTSSKKGSTKGKQDEINEGGELFGKALDFASTKSTLEKEGFNLGEIREVSIEEDTSRVTTAKENNTRRRSKRNVSSEPSLIKKSRTSVC